MRYPLNGVILIKVRYSLNPGSLSKVGYVPNTSRLDETDADLSAFQSTFAMSRDGVQQAFFNSRIHTVALSIPNRWATRNSGFRIWTPSAP